MQLNKIGLSLGSAGFAVLVLLSIVEVRNRPQRGTGSGLT